MSADGVDTMKRILLIEDDEAVRTLISGALTGAGYEVFEAADGKKGMKLYEEVQPDLVITDLVMPEKDGIETIIELRRDFPRVKIIAVSGGGRYGQDSYLQVAGKLGAERALAKPYKISDLLEAVREVLEVA